MRGFLIVETIFEERHEVIELPRLNDRPRKDVELPLVKFRDEIVLLLVSNDALEFSKESEQDYECSSSGNIMCTHSPTISSESPSVTSFMMMQRMLRKSVGF